MRWAMAIAILLHAPLIWSGFEGKRDSERYYLVEPRFGGVVPLKAVKPSRRLLPTANAGETESDLTSPQTLAGPSRLSVSDVINWGNPPPDYPFTAIQNGWEGTVEVKLRGSEVSVVASSGHHTLDEAALRWARHCQVPPDLRARDILVPIVYRLDN